MMMERPLRVVMIIQGYAPLVGGAERQVGALAPRLQAEGLHVDVITRRYSGLEAHSLIDGVQVYRLPIPGPKAVASLSFTLNALPLIARLKPDVIHAHEVFSPATTAVAAKRLYGIPVVVTAHRSGPIGDVQRLREKFMGAKRMRTFIRQVDRFTVISREIDSELAGEGVPAEKRVLINNGVDTARFTPALNGDRRAGRLALGLPPDVPLAVFVGRLVPEKRVNNLLAVWEQVRASLPGATLAVLGSGPEETAWRRAAGEGVVFYGSQDHVLPYLQAADLYVQPSAAEGLPMAVLEAMSCGLPVVATAVGGNPEVVRPGQTGFLIPPDDLPALQAALLQGLRTDPALGLNARQLMLEHYSLDETARRLKAVYSELAAQRGAA